MIASYTIESNNYNSKYQNNQIDKFKLILTQSESN